MKYLKRANCIVRFCTWTWYYTLFFMLFPHIFQPSGSKLLKQTPPPCLLPALSSSLLSLHLCPLLCSLFMLMQRVIAVMGEGEGSEYLMAFLINRRCPAAMVILTNAGKIQKIIFFVYLFHWGGKSYTRKPAFSALFFFFPCLLCGKVYMSKYFLLWAKVFFKAVSCGWQ